MNATRVHEQSPNVRSAMSATSWTPSVRSTHFNPDAIVASQLFVSLDKQSAFTRIVTEPDRHRATPRVAGGGGAKRGVVRGMSKRSARRLRRMLSFVEYTRDMSFLTLTYRDAVDMQKVKHDLNVLFQRIKRYFPRAWGIWKLERQKRGAWHIHILLVNMPFWAWQNIVDVWSAVSQQDASRATNIKHVRSLRELRAYLSKYIAKPADAEEEATGRMWGIFNRKVAVFVAVSCYLTSAQFFRLRREVQRLRYNVESFNFWIYRASSIVTSFLEDAFDIQRETFTYSQFARLVV